MAASAPILPYRVSLDVHGRLHAVRKLQLSGHRAYLTTPCALVPDDTVRLEVGWSDGSSTTLPVRVRAVAPAHDTTTSEHENVAHVDVEAVQGDWRSFLAFLGPTALAS